MKIPKMVRSFIHFYCPVCEKILNVVGLVDERLWCHNCKQAYVLRIIKSKEKEQDLKNVVGFPK